MKNVASFLHLLFCKKPHFSGLPTELDYDKEDCCWYIEDQLEDSWDRPHHQEWLVKGMKMAQLFSDGDENKLSQFLNKLTSILSQLNFLIDSNKELKSLVKGLIIESLKD